MPRYQPKAIEAKKQAAQPQRRQLTRPWTVRAAPNGFAVYTANGIFLFTVDFTADQMREHFPDGLTFEEAQGVALTVVESINQRDTPTDSRSPDQLRRDFYRGPPGTLKGRAVSGFR